MKFTYICLLALFSSTLAAKTKTNMRAEGSVIPTYNNGDTIIDTALNANYDPDLVANLNANGVLDVEKEHEKSWSYANSYSAESHKDSQQVDISIHFNINLDDSSSSSSSDE